MTLPPDSRLSTHAVANQPENAVPGDPWTGDGALRMAAAALPGADQAALADYAGTLEAARGAGREANRFAPELRLFDRAGRRLDEVAYHPAYHQFMQISAQAGYAARSWEEQGSHLAHAAMVYMASQVEPGHCCPLTMSYAALPVLDAAGEGIDPVWRRGILARDYDPGVAPAAAKRALTLGMAMTEKQGGSDLRQTATTAEPAEGAYRLTGHKWFCSAPMSDGFLTLAQAPGGLTCFLVPRWTEAGRNGIRLMRLKDKLGNRSNASAEIEYEGALAWRIGEEGEGVRRIIAMVHHTRLDTALAPAGLMRAALAEALHWVRHRRAFGARLADQPLMAQVLADLALDREAALALGMRVARAFDGRDDAARAFARIGVALGKFLNNKLCPPLLAEAMEALGGMGYVEDTPLPLLYREAPLNGIWEGSGNVICLDILRALARDPGCREALDAALAAARGSDAGYDAALEAHRRRWRATPEPAAARAYATEAATLLAAASLIATAPAAIAESYVAARLGAGHGRRIAGAGDAIAAAARGALFARILPD
ncbi:acyl-CoA dehydrogenase family protein [Roseivivax sp. CAU 1761]